MSFEPEQIAASIKKHIPNFEMDYDVDPVDKQLLIAGQILLIQLQQRKSGALKQNMI